MSQTAIRTEPVAIAAFDVFLEAAAEDREYELIDGVIFLMANPNENHEQIAANIGARLKLAMDARHCRTYQGGMRVQASAASSGHDKYRPDLMVRCGPRGNATFVTDPVVVVEVLSPSAMDRDRGRKLTFYKALATMQHIVLAYADQMRLEHYFRVPEGWECGVLTGPEDVLDLAAVEFHMELSTVYFDVAALPASQRAIPPRS